MLLKTWRGVLAVGVMGLAVTGLAQAQDTVCARVKIEIKQDLTLERQGFEAEMKISNTTEAGVIDNVSVVVNVTDENGVPVAVSSDPNDLTAKFFIRLSNKQGIDNVDGSGVVAAQTAGIIDWLLIPAPGAAGTSPLGKKYLVGATLRYRFGGDASVLEVDPDVITVKPLPLLTLDYFLPRDVEADDPLTAEVEPVVPFTLGVRVKNNGVAAAKNLKIDSAQPKIVENNQGLLINFSLVGSYVNDAVAANSLLADFGDVAGNTSKTARWIMEASLAGRFTEFTARFTHADELGGALTSILQGTNAHEMIRDVRVDLPGRDYVRDFLARDGDVIRLYESEGLDTIVTDRSSVATFAQQGGAGAYRLTFPATAGFAYVKLADPFLGALPLQSVIRSDAKQLAPENMWLSRTRNAQTKKWEYWINFFDVNTSGDYASTFDATAPVPGGPPVLQFVADQVVEAGRQVSFVVEASSPGGKAVTLTAAGLPANATFTLQAPTTSAPGLARAIFDWTPGTSAVGVHAIAFNATDGTQSTTRSATVRVTGPVLPAGPAVPAVASPLSGASLYLLQPVLAVQAATRASDPTTTIEFELYADAAMTQLTARTTVAKAAAGASGVPVPTQWKLGRDLEGDTRYWWRARAFDGSLYSPWTNARFITLSNASPAVFNQTSPAADAQVDTLTPALYWTNSVLRDGDPITYAVTIYSDAAMTQVVAQASNLTEDSSGITGWTPTAELADGVQYYWRVTAKRASGGQVSATPRAFTVNLANHAPTAPGLFSAAGGIFTTRTPRLSAAGSSDADKDNLSYVFEVDRVATFDSPARRTSGKIPAIAKSVTWAPPALEDNAAYWWRVKADDGRAGSPWSVGRFLVSLANDAPPAPTVRNPGNGAWTGTPHPTLQVNPVQDPEGDSVQYAFEVFADAGLTQKVADGVSGNGALQVAATLPDRAWFWWRARAQDGQGAASPWSTPVSMYVSTALQDLAIELVAPALPQVPAPASAANGNKRLATIAWDGMDPAQPANVSLFYSTAGTGFGGTPIVQGLVQAAGTGSGSYVWDVGSLVPGAYHVYATAYDSTRTGQAYAAGTVVIPNPASAAKLVAANPGKWVEGNNVAIGVSWTGASGLPLFLPFSTSIAGIQNGIAIAASAAANGSRLTATPVSFACSTQGQQFPLTVGPVITDDPALAGKIAVGGTALMVYAESNASDPSVRVCDLNVLSEKPVSATQSDYLVTARISNLGASLASASAVATSARTDLAPTGTLTFGAVASGETGTATGLITVRGPLHAPSAVLLGLRWNVQLARPAN